MTLTKPITEKSRISLTLRDWAFILLAALGYNMGSTAYQENFGSGMSAAKTDELNVRLKEVDAKMEDIKVRQGKQEIEMLYIKVAVFGGDDVDKQAIENMMYENAQKDAHHRGVVIPKEDKRMSK